ncbi:VOC family protein [Mycobacterium sp. DBP42]|uniref:VOC family protein n=1 Tax=Mycobacterium sp. DBP42 TaxID=2545267 RepID=UPI00352C5918
MRSPPEGCTGRHGEMTCLSRGTPSEAQIHPLRGYGRIMAAVRQFQVTLDCADPERLARFWCAVLGYVIPPPPPGFDSWADFDRTLPQERQGSMFACEAPSGSGPRLFFQRVPEGKVVKNRLHLDVRVGGCRTDRSGARGGTRGRVRQAGRVGRDPRAAATCLSVPVHVRMTELDLAI